MDHSSQYIIIGGGMAADAAARGIRQVDSEGKITLFSKEPDPPYNRPPLSKGLWKRMPINRIWRQTANLNVELVLNTAITRINPQHKSVVDHNGNLYIYEKLLLATGGDPIKISPSHPRILYYRTVKDYLRLRELIETVNTFAVIGGGFIGSEMAAVLASSGKQVTMIFPENGIGARVLPIELSKFLNEIFTQRGVRILKNHLVSSLEPTTETVDLNLSSGEKITVDAVIIGVGIKPNTTLAQEAGLRVENGIVVDAKMRSTVPDIFAAGDVASFYNPTLNQRLRVEHEENANLTGLIAGKGMAGQLEEYNHLPAVYSSLFDLNYDAVGDLNPQYDIVYDWIEPFNKGTVYYFSDHRIRGVLLWNQQKGLDFAREWIAKPGPIHPGDIKGSIKV